MIKVSKAVLLVGIFSVSGVISAESFDDSVFSTLDYGLYWAGADNEFEKASVDTQDGSNYYDPDKPTIIYIHGWQSDSVETLYRETFYNTHNDSPYIDFASMWERNGYNIGIMYWNQFADESEVKDAEAKIWSTAGSSNMRWLDSQGDYHYGDVDKPIAELFFDNYVTAMTGYNGGDIRIAGHSLGSQIAMRLTRLIQESAEAGEVSENLVPDRLTLLDAFFSNGAKSYLDDQWTGESARDLADEMIAYGTAIDSYRTSVASSSIFVGDENTELHNKLAFSEGDTSYFSVSEQSEKHSAAVWLYLWSIDYSEPVVEDSVLVGVSASADNDLVRSWMDADVHIDQKEGGSTKDPVDDTYLTTNRL